MSINLNPLSDPELILTNEQLQELDNVYRTYINLTEDDIDKNAGDYLIFTKEDFKNPERLKNFLEIFRSTVLGKKDINIYIKAVDVSYKNTENFIVSIKERINALDSYITHLNTTSTVICNGRYEMVDGFLLGHEDKFYVNTPIRFMRFYDTLFSVKNKHHDLHVSKDGFIFYFNVLEIQKLVVFIPREGVVIEKPPKSPLGKREMHIVSKFFKYEKDYVDVVKLKKEYRELVDNYNYNPITIDDFAKIKKTENMRYIHIYEEDKDPEVIESGKEYMLWKPINYLEWYYNRLKNVIYKNICFTREDLMKISDREGQRLKITKRLEKMIKPNVINRLTDSCFENVVFEKNENGKIITELMNLILSNNLISIGQKCFAKCLDLKEIKLPKSLTEISNKCFSECSNLTSIKLPEYLYKIGKSAFEECSSLKTITIPSYVSTIGSGCFSLCTSLSEINIPTRVTSLGNDCFWNCSSLSSITIPSTISTIGKNCFYYCSNLSEIIINGGHIKIKEGCFADCHNLTKFIFNGIEVLEENLFSDSGISQIVFSIGKQTFNDTIKRMNGFCFSGCTNLVNIKLPKNLEYIGEYTFCNCLNLESISIPSSVTYLGSGCFMNCVKLTSAVIEPDNPPRKRGDEKVKKIVYRDLFSGCPGITEKQAKVFMRGMTKRKGNLYYSN